MTVTLGLIVINNGCAGEVTPLLSLTVTLKLNGLPVTVVGVPLITPVEEFSAKPGGSDPELTLQLL